MSDYRHAACLLAVLASLLAGCSADELEVIVEVRTDLVSAVEFDRVRTDLLTELPTIGPEARAGSNEISTSASQRYSEGVRVAEFDAVPPGEYFVRAQLSLGPGIVAERTIRIDVSTNTAVSVVITRSCRGVTCPRAADPASAIACVGGICRSSECATGREEACPPRECAASADCPAPAASCATADCVDGLCLATAEDASCEAGERCHPELGCVDTGTCVPLAEICNGLDDDCDEEVDEDFDFAADPDHCGGCGAACSAANAMATCSGGSCALECRAGFADCNGMTRDGCEADLSTANDCGACGSGCSPPTPLCEEDGSGGVRCAADCDAGMTRCGSSCVDTASSLSHCGACGAVCDLNDATGACYAGVCTIDACATDFVDCDGDASNGCEARLDTLSNCGACGTTCSRTGATATCADGTCRILSCSGARENCNGDDTDGCEASLLSLTDCGSCGAACALANATMSCITRTCRFTGCQRGFADCDDVDANGCEVRTQDDESNCGVCGHACDTGRVCMTGLCFPG